MPKLLQLLLRSKTRHNNNLSPRSLQLIQTCTNNARVSTCWENCFYICLYFRTYLSTFLRKTTWSQLLTPRLSSSLMKLANSLQLPTAPGHPRPYTFPPSVLSPDYHRTHNFSQTQHFMLTLHVALFFLDKAIHSPDLEARLKTRVCELLQNLCLHDDVMALLCNDSASRKVLYNLMTSLSVFDVGLKTVAIKTVRLKKNNIR